MTTTIVYRYGLHAPHEGAEHVQAQMYAAHGLRNDLVQIERGRRAAVRALEREIGGDIPGLIAALVDAAEAAEEAAKAARAWRAKTRLKKLPVELSSTLQDARLREREARKALGEARATLKTSAEYEWRVDEIGQIAKALALNAYEHSGCYWGQRALMVEDASRSAAQGLYDAHGGPNDPRFARWMGEGRVHVQIQGGASAADVCSTEHTQLQIRLPDARAWRLRDSDGKPDRAARRRYGSTAELAMRVGSEGRDPVWARWVLDMERPLPDGARIQDATVHRTMRGPHSYWHLTVTLRLAEGAYAHNAGPARLGGAVAVDVGWRQIGDELRVAGWRDEHGNEGDLRLDARLLKALHEPEKIRAERDDRLNGLRDAVRWWSWWQPEGAVPEWLLFEIRAMHSWRSPGRFEVLRQKWGKNRFPGDDPPWAMLEAYCARDRHEWAVESEWRTRVLLRRRELYRIFAARLATDYDTIVVEKFDKREIAIRPEVGADQKRENEVARSNRVVAAVSELVGGPKGAGAIVMAARSRARTCAIMPCEDTTRTCPACGTVEDRDAAADRVLECACGHVWDQDVSGAPVVLLARWRERPGDARILVGARVVEKAGESEGVAESRWQRARRLRAEKEARMEAARKAASGAAE